MKFSEILKKIKSKVFGIFSKNKKLSVLSLILVIALLVSIIFFPSSDSEEKETKQNDTSVQQTNSSDYTSYIETKIKTMLLNLDEVSKAEVMVVCDSTEIYEYLKNHEESKSDNGSTTIREEVVYQKDGSDTSPIVVTSKMPKVLGVWIIVNSVSASTKLAITNSIKSVLNIDESCISILQER